MAHELRVLLMLHVRLLLTVLDEFGQLLGRQAVDGTRTWVHGSERGARYRPSELIGRRDVRALEVVDELVEVRDREAAAGKVLALRNRERRVICQ